MSKQCQSDSWLDRHALFNAIDPGHFYLNWEEFFRLAVLLFREPCKDVP